MAGRAQRRNRGVAEQVRAQSNFLYDETFEYKFKEAK
jgi:hypothetical protein